MSVIQRWDMFAEVGINEPVKYDMWEAVEGRYVLYADHVAAVAAAEQRAGEQAHAHYMDGYNAAWSLSAAEIERQVREEEQVAQSLAVAESFAAGVKAARDAVAGLPVLLVDVRFNPDDASRYVGAVNVSDALAAIDALEKP